MSKQDDAEVSTAELSYDGNFAEKGGKKEDQGVRSGKYECYNCTCTRLCMYVCMYVYMYIHCMYMYYTLCIYFVCICIIHTSVCNSNTCTPVVCWFIYIFGAICYMHSYYIVYVCIAKMNKNHK